MNPLQKSVWVLLCSSLLVSTIHAPYPNQMVLQHIPTVLILLPGPFLAKRFPLTNTAFLCLAAFLFLHIVAARHIYSYVPYDEWIQTLFGFSIDGYFGFRRNHFDRLVRGEHDRHLGVG